MLVFRDEQALQETLDLLGKMDSESLQSWNRSMGFTSLREIFNNVTREESIIDDYYQTIASASPLGMRLVPAQAVHSSAYDAALASEQFQLIDDGAGEYLYYGIRDSYLAAVLDPQGRIGVAGVLTQHLPGGTRKASFQSLDAVDAALAQLPHAQLILQAPDRGKTGEIGGQAIAANASDWIYSSRVNNGWDNHGNRRYRTWIEGNSHRYFDAAGRQELYVRNVLRIQGMKKNIFGSWGFRETYTTYVDLTWWWSYIWNDRYNWDLPVPASTWLSPTSWSSSYVNDATIAISPHINGHYFFNCTSCGIVEPVIPDGGGGTVNINGAQLNPLEYEVINVYY